MRFRLLAATALTLLSTFSPAHEYQLGQLQVEHPWARALPPNAPAGAAYFMLKNGGEQDDRLLGAQTPIADKAELHMHVQKGELMQMQQIDSLEISAGAQATFAPGGHHLMLFGLKKPLVAGERFPLTLEFEKAGKLEVEVAVEETAPPADAHGHH